MYVEAITSHISAVFRETVYMEPATTTDPIRFETEHRTSQMATKHGISLFLQLVC